MELWARAQPRDPELAATRAELDDRWRLAIADVVRYGRERGEFGPADPEEFAVLLASLLDGLSVQIALRDTEVTPERVPAGPDWPSASSAASMEVTRC